MLAVAVRDVAVTVVAVVDFAASVTTAAVIDLIAAAVAADVSVELAAAEAETEAFVGVEDVAAAADAAACVTP